MFITTLIQTLTSRTTGTHRTAPRRALRPCLDGLESRLSPGGGWTAPVSYTPPTYVATTTTPTSTTPTQWTGTMTPQVMPPSTIV